MTSDVPECHATSEGTPATTLLSPFSASPLSVNCKNRNTKVNVRGFGDYIHLGGSE
jgi:hypothetical protein